MIRVIDHKAVDMTDEEFEYYNKIIEEFTYGIHNGKEQFHDIFDVDDDGCILLIRPSLKKQVAWAAIMFLQNLMINQRLRRMETKIKEILGDKSINS